jgi:hypothetical protein
MRRRISACILFILVDFEALGTISEHAAPLTLTNEVIPQPTHPPLPQPTHQVKPAPELDLATGLRESFFWRELVYLLINCWTLLRAAGVVRTPNSCIFDHICHPAFLCFPSAHRKDIERSLGVCQASSAHALRGG